MLCKGRRIYPLTQARRWPGIRPEMWRVPTPVLNWDAKMQPDDESVPVMRKGTEARMFFMKQALAHLRINTISETLLRLLGVATSSAESLNAYCSLSFCSNHSACLGQACLSELKISQYGLRCRLASRKTWMRENILPSINARKKAPQR